MSPFSCSPITGVGWSLRIHSCLLRLATNKERCMFQTLHIQCSLMFQEKSSLSSGPLELNRYGSIEEPKTKYSAHSLPEKQDNNNKHYDY